MEEAEVPLEHLQEQVHHSVEHSGAVWISWVALSTAILAVLAAIAGLLSGRHVNEAMMNQIKARPLRERAGTDQIGSRAQGSRGEITLSQARSVRARRDHVPNRNCHRGDFRAYEETAILDRESTFRDCRLRLSRPRRHRKVGAVHPNRPGGSGLPRRSNSEGGSIAATAFFPELRSVISVEVSEKCKYPPDWQCASQPTARRAPVAPRFIPGWS